MAVDQWYWLKYKDAVKSQKQCPPDMPEYILDYKQWYPPVYGWVLSLFPNGFFKHLSGITQLLSVIRVILIFAFASSVGADISMVMFPLLVIYLSAPILVYYDNQLNSRIFGALVLDILMILFYYYFDGGDQLLLIPLVFFTVLLLFTHKMSHQLYLFILLGLSIKYVSVIPFAVYVGANLIALVFGYTKYFKAHLEIVAFWHRHRNRLGAHTFYESTLYGKEGYVGQNRLHGNGIQSLIKKTAIIIGMFPFLIFLVFNGEWNFFGVVCAGTILLIFLTSFVEIFYCIGAGSLYTYNLVSFSGYYLVTTPLDWYDAMNQFLLAAVALLTVSGIYKFYRGLRRHDMTAREAKETAFDFLKQSDIDRLLVIPFQLPDEVAYKTKKQVFFGGHGYGFKWLEPYWPVFNEPVENAVREWNLGGVFLQKNYWPEFFERVDQSMFEKVFENDTYIILSVKNWENKSSRPAWADQMYAEG